MSTDAQHVRAIPKTTCAPPLLHTVPPPLSRAAAPMPLIPARPRARLALRRRVACDPPASQHRSRKSSSSSIIDRAPRPPLPRLVAPHSPPPADRSSPLPTATPLAPSRTTTTGQGLRVCGLSALHPLAVFRNDASDGGGGSNHSHRQQQRRQQQEEQQQEQRTSSAASPLTQHRHVFVKMSEQVPRPSL